MSTKSTESGHATHSAPHQLYSDDAANMGFVIALGIMAAAALVIMVGILLSVFYLRVAPTGVVGSSTMMVLCTLSTFIPVGIALRITKSIGGSHHY